MRIDGNKLYLRGAYNDCEFIVGIGKEVIAFGRSEIPRGESFTHIKKEDWKKVKEFVEEQLGK